jgi:hypothetical protein
MTRETLFDGGENADVGVGMALTLGPRAVIAEERFDAVGEVGCLLPIDMDDQSRAFAVAVVDDEREFVEAVGVTVGLELVGNGVGEIGESSIRR